MLYPEGVDCGPFLCFASARWTGRMSALQVHEQLLTSYKIVLTSESISTDNAVNHNISRKTDRN